MPSNPWGIVQNPNTIYLRNEHGAWYNLSRRISKTSPPNGDFLSNDNLSDIVRGNDDLRIVHLETDFQARSDGAQQTSISLLVKFIEENDGVKYVQSYMHLHVALLEVSRQGMFEAAHRCAKQLAETEPARKLAAISDGAVDMENLEYKTIFDELQPEILRIALMKENEPALAAVGLVSGANPSMLFGAFIGMIFIGHYGITGEVSQETQRWCVD